MPIPRGCCRRRWPGRLCQVKRWRPGWYFRHCSRRQHQSASVRWTAAHYCCCCCFHETMLTMTSLNCSYRSMSCAASAAGRAARTALSVHVISCAAPSQSKNKHMFNGLSSRTTWVSLYHKGKRWRGFMTVVALAKPHANNLHFYLTFDLQFLNFHFLQLSVTMCCLQCFDTVGWAAGRASSL